MGCTAQVELIVLLLLYKFPDLSQITSVAGPEETGSEWKVMTLHSEFCGARFLCGLN